MLKKRYAYILIYSLILVGFSIYVALDTFVITHVYGNVTENESFEFSDQEIDNENIEENADAENAIDIENTLDTEKEIDTVDDNTLVSNGLLYETVLDTYEDENIHITVSEVRAYDSSIYIAEVEVTSLQYLKTALANNQYGRNVTENTSTIAESVDAILAINGDYYGAQESGYVIRNGTLYRSEGDGGDGLVIWADGSFEVISEREVTASELVEKGAYQVLSFGPALLENNEITVSENDEVGKAKSSNPRTAIGIIDNNHFVFVVSDGRTSESKGLSLYQLGEFMQTLGVQTAYNLDGGGSSTMYFNGVVINNPTTNGKRIEERSVSDIVYIGY